MQPEYFDFFWRVFAGAVPIGEQARAHNQVSIVTARHSAVIDTRMHLLGDIRYGSIEITIHDTAVVQIERKERIRR